MSTLELIAYYADLLILQYVGKTRAYQTIQAFVKPAIMPTVTIQEIVFSESPDSGSFFLIYGDESPLGPIPWNTDVSLIELGLQVITGSPSLTVTGSIAEKSLVVTFNGLPPPVELLVIDSNTLTASSVSVDVSVSETDLTLPLLMQNSFDLDTAVGVQLDVIGKYQNVTRNVQTLDGPITLSDEDFRSFIKVAIMGNYNGSSLSEIQNLIMTFFPGLIIVFDFQNMRLSYFLDSAIGSVELAQAFVKSGLLPKPMGVQLASVIYSHDIYNFFGFRTYALASWGNSPFNTYGDYQTDRPWLSYSDAIIV